MVAQKGYLLVCGDRELELAQIAFPDGELSTACESIQPPGKTLTPEQTLLSVGSRVSRKKEYAPPLLTACETFTRSKDPATGKVEDAQEEEDGSLEGVEVTYKQGGEQLEIDYDVFKKGFHEVRTAATLEERKSKKAKRTQLSRQERAKVRKWKAQLVSAIANQMEEAPGMRDWGTFYTVTDR